MYGEDARHPHRILVIENHAIVAWLSITKNRFRRVSVFGTDLCCFIFYFSVPGKNSATVPGPTCAPVTGS